MTVIMLTIKNITKLILCVELWFLFIFAFFAEPIYIHSTIPTMQKASTPLLNQRKIQDLETEAKNDKAKPGNLKQHFKSFSIYIYTVLYRMTAKTIKGFPKLWFTNPWKFSGVGWLINEIN